MTTITLTYAGNGSFEASSNLDKSVISNNYRQGERVTFSDVKPRSYKNLKWWHAIVKKAWDNLPDHHVERWPTPEHFRKAVLCAVGHSDISNEIYSTKEDALKAITAARFSDDYLVVFTEGNIATIMKAKSQSYKAQGQKDFKETIDRALQEMSGLLNCDVTELLGDVSGIPAWVSGQKQVAA